MMGFKQSTFSLKPSILNLLLETVAGIVVQIWCTATNIVNESDTFFLTTAASHVYYSGMLTFIYSHIVICFKQQLQGAEATPVDPTTFATSNIASLFMINQQFWGLWGSVWGARSVNECYFFGNCVLIGCTCVKNYLSPPRPHLSPFLFHRPSRFFCVCGKDGDKQQSGSPETSIVDRGKLWKRQTLPVRTWKWHDHICCLL